MPRFSTTRAALTAVLFAAAVVPPDAHADEIHFTSGKVLHGLLEKETRSGYSFLEAGTKRAKSYRRKDVARMVLTFAPPDFVATDPRWSQEMVDARITPAFDKASEVEVLRSDHYVVFTDSSAGKKYLETMEDIYERFLEVYPFTELPGAMLMPVFLFKTNDGYFRYYAKIARVSMESARQTGGHAWRDYYATYYQAPRDPVHYHEGAHQLVANRLDVRAGGSWFQEGMAVYFEGTVFPGEDPAKGMKSAVGSGRYTPLPDFVKLPSLLYSSDDNRDPSLGRRRYKQAGALIKFLKEGPWKDKWSAFLTEVRTGARPEAVFLAVYEKSMDEVDAAFVEYYGG